MNKLTVFVCAMVLVIGIVEIAWSYPVLDQTGNLIQNGNFETESISPWLTEKQPNAIISDEIKVEGQSSVFIDTTISGAIESIGLYQYEHRTDGTYTASAWFYPIEGQAHIGIAWRSGMGGYSSFSTPTTLLNKWYYLEVTTGDYWGSEGGVLLYSVDNNMGKFYVDAVWLNEGSVNLSPYAPQNGFVNPNPVPIPSAIWLLGPGLLGLAGFRRKLRKD